MAKTTAKKYRARNWVSVRKSRDPNDPRYHEFIDWEPGDIVEDYPPYTAIEEWLRAGHIEVMDVDSIGEVSGG